MLLSSHGITKRRLIQTGDTMKNIAKTHQLAIAKRTLRMTPTMARIMGGMDFETAYRTVFHTDLHQRCRDLTKQYDSFSESFSWELGTYGWDNPAEVLSAL